MTIDEAVEQLRNTIQAERHHKLNDLLIKSVLTDDLAWNAKLITALRHEKIWPLPEDSPSEIVG